VLSKSIKEPKIEIKFFILKFNNKVKKNFKAYVQLVTTKDEKILILG
jgi:hypothetical protein